MFSSRRAIAEEFGVSLGTVQQAVSALVADGFLEAKGNMGTVIGMAAGQRPSLDSFRITPTARGYVGIVTHLAPLRDGENFNWRTNMIHGIEREAANLGHPTMLTNLYRPTGEQLSAADGITEAIMGGAEAVIGLMIETDPHVMATACRAAWASRPIVLGCAEPLRLPAIHCSYDSISDGYRATQHLIDVGARKLLYMSISIRSWAQDRLQGARTAVEHNPETPIEFDAYIDNRAIQCSMRQSEVIAEAYAAEILATGKRYDGIIAANDAFAYGYINAARKLGLEPGIDYAIVGFDDHPDSQAIGLTTLRPPIEGIGVQTARLAVAALRREEHPSHVCLRSHLVTRRTTQFKK
jgi:DNA-binding LacI/PurR family transcriptional regulator